MTKKVSSKIISAVLVIMFVFSAVTVASAANVRDEVWRFDFTKGPEQYTTNREKQNTTKIYFKRTDSYSGYTFDAIACGAYTSTGTPNQNASISPTTNRQAKFEIHAGATYYITNWVAERDYSYAAVKGTLNGSSEFIANGVWSPDNSSGI